MPADPIEYIIDPTKKSLFNWQEVWRYRELFYFFSWRDIKIKYKQTALGFLWVILQPLLMMLVFTFFFSHALRIPSQDLPYPVYVLSGLLIWNAFSSGLTGAAHSMVTNAAIIRKVYFPRLVVPVASILVALFDFLISFALFVAVLLYFRQPVSWMAVWAWPAAILLSGTATLGLGCWIAALNVKYRDFRYVIPFLVQLLFFLSPVIYPVSLLKYPVLQYLLVSSPLYAALELFRAPLTGVLPDGVFMLTSLSLNLILLFIGTIYFRSTEEFFADLA